MRIAVGQSRILRSALVDVYEGGFLKPCSAQQRRFTVTPPIAAVEGDAILANTPGSASITAEVDYGDGVGWRQVDGSIALDVIEGPAPVEMSRPPQIVSVKLVDIDQ